MPCSPKQTSLPAPRSPFLSPCSTRLALCCHRQRQLRRGISGAGVQLAVAARQTKAAGIDCSASCAPNPLMEPSTRPGSSSSRGRLWGAGAPSSPPFLPWPTEFAKEFHRIYIPLDCFLPPRGNFHRNGFLRSVLTIDGDAFAAAVVAHPGPAEPPPQDHATAYREDCWGFYSTRGRATGRGCCAGQNGCSCGGDTLSIILEVTSVIMGMHHSSCGRQEGDRQYRVVTPIRWRARM